MKWVIGYFSIQILILMALIIASWFIWDRRFKTKHGKQVPKGFIRTNEISIDPITNKKLVVYFNPESGERFYKEDEGN